MAKMMEMTFAIGAALSASFSGAFGKAGKALADLQKQSGSLQKQSGQITSYQKMQGAIAKSSEKLNAARMRVKELGLQMKAAGTPTAALKKEFATACQEAHRLETQLGNQRKQLGELRTELTGAGIDTKNLSTEQSRLSQQSQKLANAQSRLQRSQAALQQTRQNLSWDNIKGELMTAAGLGYSLYKPVNEAADFEQAMARVNAVAFSGAGRDKAADAEAFKALQEQARQLGRDTQFTAVQAAQSQENLARAGFKANEIIAAMPGLLNMAAAEGMDLATASDIAASTLRGFKMNADQANRVADVLAQTSAASNTSISGLGESMKMVAPVAANLGVSVEEVSAMLGIMGNAGIKGTESGSALRNAFLRLAQEPKSVEKALAKLGVASRDAQGNMRNLPDILTALSEKMKDMGEADKTKYLADIFGVRSVSGMMAVMNGALDGSLQQLHQFNNEATGILTAMSEATGASLDDMRTAMKGLDPLTEELGISYRDLSIYTGILAQSGMKGSDANKALNATFTSLLKNSKNMQKALKGYDISIVGDDGTLRDMPDLLNDLNRAFSGMSDSDQLAKLSKIFGADAAKGIQMLMKGIGEGAFTELNGVADKASGVASEMAGKTIDTLKGQMTIAGSAVSDLMITIGDVLLPTVKEAVIVFTNFTAGLSKFAQANPGLTKAIVGSVGALAAMKVGLVGAKVGWNLLKLPFQTARVGLDLLNVRMLTNAKAVTEAGKRTGLLSKAWKGIQSSAKGIGNAFKTLASGIGKAFTGILSFGKSLISGLFSPLGLKVLALSAVVAGFAALAYLVYKNWDSIKAWWDSWTIKDVFAALKGYALSAYNWVKGKWNEFWAWWDKSSLKNIFAPVIGFATTAEGYASSAWKALSNWWQSWTLADVFAPVIEFATTAEGYASRAWEHLAGWWQSWSLKDIFTPIMNLATNAKESAQAKWNELKSWWDGWNLKDIFEIVKTYVETVKTQISAKWEEFNKRWSDWKLADIFAPIYKFALDVIERIKAPFKAFAEYVSSLNPFKDWGTPAVSAEQIAQGKKLLQNPGNAKNQMPCHMRGFASGGFISHPEIALIGEAGREAIIPLEDRARGIPLWKAAGEEMGFSFGTQRSEKTIAPVFSPSVNITVNGGDTDTESKFRQILQDTFEDMFADFQNRLQRVAFE